MTKTAAHFESVTLEVVSFMAGGYRFAVEAAQVRTQLCADQADTVAMVERLLGLSCEEPQNTASRRILLIKHATEDYAVSVSNPVELHCLEIDTIYPLPALIVARTTLTGIRGLALGPEGVTLLVDFRRMLPQNLFN
ncbi:MAG: hypothetical protein QX203_00955 [Methylococcaceae bacterium]